MKTFIQFLIKSLGVKRRLTAALNAVALVAVQVPQLAAISGAIGLIAQYLGLTGVAHATVSGTLGKSPLSTIAAFFSALVLASTTFPQLQPYHGLFLKVAEFFSVLSVGSTFKRQ